MKYENVKMIQELYCKRNGGIYLKGDDDKLYIPVDIGTMLDPNGRGRNCILYEAINYSIDEIVADSIVTNIEEKLR